MIDLPPIDVIATLQNNIVQTMLSVLVACIIGMVHKLWHKRVLYAALAFIPSFYVVGTAIELLSNANWNYLIAVLFVMIGTWIVSKESVKKG